MLSHTAAVGRAAAVPADAVADTHAGQAVPVHLAAQLVCCTVHGEDAVYITGCASVVLLRPGGRTFAASALAGAVANAAGAAAQRLLSHGETDAQIPHGLHLQPAHFELQQSASLIQLMSLY
jgi:hypothetical protein